MLKLCFSFVLTAMVFGSAADLYAFRIYDSDSLEINIGGLLRFRQELIENAFDFDDRNGIDDGNLFRLKSSLCTSFDFKGNWGGLLKISNEARYFIIFPGYDKGLDQDEVFFDNLYAYIENVFNLPIDIFIGRQDLLGHYGEGFLINEGTPEDGSRSYYFNAIRVVLRPARGHCIEFAFLDNPEKDHFLPSFYEAEKRLLNHSDERGLVFYGKHKISDHLSLEPYYIYKYEENPAMAFCAPETNLDLHTIGARLVYSLGDYTFRGECARQFGEYDSGTDRLAIGGYAFISRKFDLFASPSVCEIGAVYVSGDDPDTLHEDEGFDPLFSRWPWLSELLGCSMVLERGVYYRTNLEWYRADFIFAPSPTICLDLKYNYLRAPENANNPFSVSGEHERGHLVQAKITYHISKNFRFHMLIEHMIPGDHYKTGDQATLLQWQFQMHF